LPSYAPNKSRMIGTLSFHGAYRSFANIYISTENETIIIRIVELEN